MDINLWSLKQLGSKPIVKKQIHWEIISFHFLICCMLFTTKFQIAAKGICGEVVRCNQMTGTRIS